MARIVMSIFISLVVLAAAGSAAAEPGRHGGDWGKDRSGHFVRMLENNKDRIGLSDDTMAQIQEIVAASRVSAEKLDGELHDAHTKMRELLSENRPAEAAVMSQAERIGTLETKSLQLRLGTLLQIRPLLTDAQLTELRAIREQRFNAVKTACADDIAKLCPGAKGRSRRSCLREHAGELSAQCSDALNGLRRKAAEAR